eukprot:TRINITY_DN13587_c0_g2_i1.p2 TRINITY_DN13587_c0_g2~~TRINITY_DN13587_c0_g2_i1.p2  ORF type:complete len:231 (+),score=65.59 TRINITY_DN13587_c0_g2_i1:88-780(+)
MSLERMPDLGSKPVALTVRLPAIKAQEANPLEHGLRELYRKGELTDVSIVCAERSFSAHRCVLAARSPVFKEGLATQGPMNASGKQEVRLADIANPEAAKFMLDFMYQMDAAIWEDYNPRTQEINKDVLRLAQNFQLPGLVERAMHWLAKDLTTGNVVERLSICEEFSLNELREKILEQLTYNKKALAEVASSPQIMSYPKLMQAMLQLAAAVPGDDAPATGPAKKKRKA